ncbi:MAG: hypothetical protein R2741_02520 [Methanolobus sp.]
MVKIGNFDLDEKPAIVSVIDDDPAENAKAANWLGANVLELRLDLLNFQISMRLRRLLTGLR